MLLTALTGLYIVTVLRLQVVEQLPDLETLVLRWPSAPEEVEPPLEATARFRTQLVAAVTALKVCSQLALVAQTGLKDKFCEPDAVAP